MRPAPRPLKAVLSGGAALIVLAVTLGGCGNDSTDAGDAPSTSALTLDQATQLAGVLLRNTSDGGATFQLAARSDQGPGTIMLTGEVDWEAHTGHAFVVGAGSEEHVLEVHWNENAILERRADMLVLADVVGPEVEWVLRPVDLTRRLDQLVAIVGGLAGTQSDNPLLVQQQVGSAFMRADELRGSPVEVLRYGTRNTYWIDADGEMLRFEGNNEAGNAPVVVDVLSRGPQTIEAPEANTVVDISQISAVWEAVVGPGGQPST